jgi:aerobic carbon-monoxide dehydrogenase large subunit
VKEETANPIGRSLPRAEAARFVTGRGQYTDDLAIAADHIAFLRSPHAHARIEAINIEAARSAAGVRAIVIADDLAAICKPWKTRLAAIPLHASPPQFPLARGETCWQGEAVVAAVAATRAQAEDALELIEIEWTELPAIASVEAAAASGAPPVISGMINNVALDHSVSVGDVSAAFNQAAAVVEHEFVFERQTGVTLETRTIVADFEPRLRQLTVWHSHQVPHQMREIFADQLGLPLRSVRVVTPDVGGAFGMKLSAYPDEMAVAAIAVLLNRPVKFCADRLESFISDNHAREAKVRGRLAVDAQGQALAMEVSIATGCGAYAAHPRGSIGEALQAVHMSGAPYRIANFRGTARSYFQNKVPSGILRAVGQPIACAVTEQLFDFAAQKVNLDPAEIRRRNYTDTARGDIRSAAGIVLGELSLQRCHDRLLEVMGYGSLRARQRELRERGVYRGIGIAVFVEQTAVGPALYGPQEIRVAAHETCRLTLDSDGSISCATSITDQGQGTRTALTQIVAREIGVNPDSVIIISGDTATTPYGGGAWASRGTALGGEAALKAAKKLRENILTIAAALLQSDATTLRIESAGVVNASGMYQMSLTDIVSMALYRSHVIPLEQIPSLEIVESCAMRKIPYIAANGIQGAHVEVDPDLGTIRVMDFWVVEDCGRVVNPLLVDEQIRGGVIQGIGAALYEQCIYNENAQLENGSLADYLVPMAGEMPDIRIAHVETVNDVTNLSARGVGEAGTVGAAAAIWTAVNDAISPFGATVVSQPFTPEHVLDRLALARRQIAPEPVIDTTAGASGRRPTVANSKE